MTDTITFKREQVITGTPVQLMKRALEPGTGSLPELGTFDFDDSFEEFKRLLDKSEGAFYHGGFPDRYNNGRRAFASEMFIGESEGSKPFNVDFDGDGNPKFTDDGHHFGMFFLNNVSGILAECESDADREVDAYPNLGFRPCGVVKVTAGADIPPSLSSPWGGRGDDVLAQIWILPRQDTMAQIRVGESGPYPRRFFDPPQKCGVVFAAFRSGVPVEVQPVTEGTLEVAVFDVVVGATASHSAFAAPGSPLPTTTESFALNRGYNLKDTTTYYEYLFVDKDTLEAAVRKTCPGKDREFRDTPVSEREEDVMGVLLTGHYSSSAVFAGLNPVTDLTSLDDSIVGAMGDLGFEAARVDPVLVHVYQKKVDGPVGGTEFVDVRLCREKDLKASLFEEEVDDAEDMMLVVLPRGLARGAIELKDGNRFGCTDKTFLLPLLVGKRRARPTKRVRVEE